MRYIYSRIWIYLKKAFRVVFGENKVRGAIIFILLAGLLTASTVMGVRSFLSEGEEIIAEDPIESYDNVVEIVIGDDGEVAESDESSSSEE